MHHWTTEIMFGHWPRNWCQDILVPKSFRTIRAADLAASQSHEDSISVVKHGINNVIVNLPSFNTCYEFVCHNGCTTGYMCCSRSFGYQPESLATILAICARSLLSSSCRAVVRFSAVTPGFLRPSILLPSRRKLGTEEFLWSTRRGVGRHSCFRGRVSLLKTEERVISYWPVTNPNPK